MADGTARHCEVSRRAFLRSSGAFVVIGSGVSLLAACGDTGTAQPQATAPARGIAVTMYRQKGCGCCGTYADYLRKSGFTVDLNTVDDLQPIRKQYNIPEAGVGCHTSVLDDYVVEGHVPVEAIDRLLSARPAIDGISVVGMPPSSPGMGEANGEPLNVLSIRDGRVEQFMSVTTF